MAKEKIDIDMLWPHWEVQLGLERLRRKKSYIRQDVSVVHRTEYYIELEWHPEGVPTGEEEGFNPPGAVMVSLDARTHRLRSYHVAGFDKLHNGTDEDVEAIQEPINLALQWIARFTGLTEDDGLLELSSEKSKENGTAFVFRQVRSGIPFYPPMQIHVRINRNGQLVSYSNCGTHTGPDVPVLNRPRPEPEPAALRQAALRAFSLVYLPKELPLKETRIQCWFYGVAETFLNGDIGKTVPYEWNFEFFAQPPLNRAIIWNGGDRPTAVRQGRLPGTTGEKIKQFNSERERHNDVIDWEDQHPDTVPFCPDELERVYETVRDWAMVRWPDGSGQWMIARVLRRSGMITAVLDRRDSGYEVGFGRIKVLVEAGTYVLIDVIELAEIPPHPPAVIGKEEAFERIAGSLTCKPYYVWDAQEKGYWFMHMVDCPIIVDALSGDVVEDL